MKQVHLFFFFLVCVPQGTWRSTGQVLGIHPRRCCAVHYPLVVPDWSDRNMTLVLMALSEIAHCYSSFSAGLIAPRVQARMFVCRSHPHTVYRPCLTCNWIPVSQASGNFWIRHLMGNTPWDTNNYMKVILGSSDPAHCQRGSCLFFSKNRILSHQYESMQSIFFFLQ